MSSSKEYVYLPVEKVLMGTGVLEQLPSEVGKEGAKRIALICSNSLLNSKYIKYLEEIVGERLIYVLSGTKQHTLKHSVFEIVAKLRDKDIDLIISFGGGSVIDTVKAICLILGESLDHSDQLDEYSVKFTPGADPVIPSVHNQLIPHFTIPTTLSAAEYSNIIGITDTKAKVKELYIDDKLTPKRVFLDPNVTLSTPDWLWLASGIKALDHAIETIYSKNNHPITTTLALEAIKLLRIYLPKCKENPNDLEARQQCQLGAWMSFFGVTNVMMGLSHGIGHQIGAHCNIPHGFTSCILLPKIMKYLLSNTREEQLSILEAMGGNGYTPVGNKQEAYMVVESMIERLELPQTLREFNVSKDELRIIASDTMKDLVIENSPKEVDREKILNILESVW